MAQNIFKGLGIALVTPFTADGEVDYTSLKRLIDYQLQNGADFLCIQATTGETPCLTVDEKAQIKLRGEYLERILTNSYIDGIESKTIMVFGIPFANHDNTHHEYARDTKQVGWYTNHNWARESAPTATARTATDDDDQRNNKYVYHNKVYYPYTIPSSAPRHIIAIFDDVPKEFDPYVDTVTDDVPWPCDVYDLSGRKVATNETPATLRINYPGLAKGVYIFGGRKMVIK